MILREFLGIAACILGRRCMILPWMLRPFESTKPLLIGIAAVVGVLAVLGFVTFIGWAAGGQHVNWSGIWHEADRFLSKHPAALFWAMVILPGLPIPLSALLLTAGVVWRENPWAACGICLVAMALNLTWTYLLAAGPARRLIEKWFASSRFKLPELPEGDRIKWIFAVKLVPGLPMCVQNYLLGCLRVPFFPYLGISLLCNGILGCGVVLTGAGVSDGKITPILTGLGLLGLGLVIASLIKSWFKQRQAATPNEP